MGTIRMQMDGQFTEEWRPEGIRGMGRVRRRRREVWWRLVEWRLIQTRQWKWMGRRRGRGRDLCWQCVELSRRGGVELA